MSDEPTVEEFHTVGDTEADAIIEMCKHAIPHNETLGRLIRNIYKRLQVVEEELAELKVSKKPKRGGP